MEEKDEVMGEVAGEQTVADEENVAGGADAPAEKVDELEEALDEARTPEQKEILNLMKNDKTFVAVRQIMEVKNEMMKVTSLRESAMAKVNAMCPDQNLSIVEARAATIDVEKMKNLDMTVAENWIKVKEFYTFEDGSMVHFTNTPDSDDIKIRELHRDFLIYLKSIKEENEKFDVYEQKMRADIKNLEDEFESIMGEEAAAKLRSYRDFADYHRQWIASTLERDDISPETRKQLEAIVISDNAGITLEYLIKEIKTLIERRGDAKSLLHGYRNNYVEVATKAEKVLSTKFAKYRYEIQMRQFFDFEKRFFPEYEKYNNLFMFILFRYIKANYEKFDNNWMITIGETLTQLGFLTKPEENRPECNKEFEEAFRTVMSLVINH